MSVVVPKLNCLKGLYTKIRDRNSDTNTFRLYANRIMNIICEEAISYMNSQDVVITTPTNCSFHGCSVVEESNIVAISIIRAGDSMLESFMNVAPNCLVGKILIQRDESTKEPVLFYSKLPSLVGKHVALLDPMLATGGSAACAVRVLLLHGAKEEDITFVNVIACPEGLKRFTSEFPGIRVVSGCVDEGLNENAYIVPGVGDFGDRYFGTC